MISLETTLSAPREAGVVYTKPWMVELVLDLGGCRREGGWRRAGDLGFVAGSIRHRRKARAELDQGFPSSIQARQIAELR